MSSIIDDLRQFLRCSICLETFTEPKILSCAHRFCKTCLNHEMDRSATSSSNPSFPCPNCRTRICLPRRSPRNEWIDYFKTDCLLKGMLEKMEEDQGDSTDVCDSHKLRLEILCYNCNMIGCVRCAWEKHRHCPKTEDFKTEAERIEHDLKHNLQKTERVLQTIDDLVNPQSSVDRSFKEQELNSNKFVEQCIKQKQHRFKSACVHLNESCNLYLRKKKTSKKMTHNIKEVMNTLLSKLDIDAKCKATIEHLKERNREALLCRDRGTSSAKVYYPADALTLAKKLKSTSQDISEILTLKKSNMVLRGQKFLVDNEEILLDQYQNHILGALSKQSVTCTLGGFITREDQVDLDIMDEEKLLTKIEAVIGRADVTRGLLDDLKSFCSCIGMNQNQNYSHAHNWSERKLQNRIKCSVIVFLCGALSILCVFTNAKLYYDLIIKDNILVALNHVAVAAIIISIFIPTIAYLAFLDLRFGNPFVRHRRHHPQNFLGNLWPF